MSFVQLFFKRPAGSVDHPPAFDGQALADFFRPPRQVFSVVSSRGSPATRCCTYSCGEWNFGRCSALAGHA
jgi:hypothetical protein